MPGSHWRSTRGNVTRARLLEEGSQQLLTKGVAGLSLRAVADACAVSNAALHYHFRSQEEFVGEVVRGWEHHVTRTLDIAAGELRGLRRAAALAQQWIGLPEVRPVLAEVIRPLDGSPGLHAARAAVIGAVDRWIGLTARAFLQARSLKELSDRAEPRRIALEVHALVWSHSWAATIQGDAWTTRVLLEAVWDRLASLALDPAIALPERAVFVGIHTGAPDQAADGFIPRNGYGEPEDWFVLLPRSDPQFHAFLRHYHLGDRRSFLNMPPVLPEDVQAAESYARGHPEEVAE